MKMNLDLKRRVYDYLIVLAALALVVFGLARAQGAEPAAPAPPTPSAQTPAPPNDAAPPWRPVRDTFATPPTDGGGPPIPPPAQPPAPTDGTGTSKTTSKTETTSEARGGLVITGNTGTIYLYSPGATAAGAPASAFPMAQPQTQQSVVGTVALAVVANPTVWARIGGGFQYMFTGTCPAKRTTPVVATAAAPPQAPAPVLMMVQAPQAPQQYVAMRPADPAPSAPQVYVVPQAPQATQGYYLPVQSPLPSPQTPRKGLFGCFGKGS